MAPRRAHLPHHRRRRRPSGRAGLPPRARDLTPAAGDRADRRRLAHHRKALSRAQRPGAERPAAALAGRRLGRVRASWRRRGAAARARPRDAHHLGPRESARATPSGSRPSARRAWPRTRSPTTRESGRRWTVAEVGSVRSYPAISGDVAVWCSAQRIGVPTINGVRVGGGEPFQVASGSGAPVVSGGLVVWAPDWTGPFVGRRIGRGLLVAGVGPPHGRPADRASPWPARPLSGVRPLRRPASGVVATVDVEAGADHDARHRPHRPGRSRVRRADGRVGGEDRVRRPGHGPAPRRRRLPGRHGGRHGLARSPSAATPSPGSAAPATGPASPRRACRGERPHATQDASRSRASRETACSCSSSSSCGRSTSPTSR